MTIQERKTRYPLPTLLAAGISLAILYFIFFVFHAPGTADMDLFSWISTYWFGSSHSGNQQSWIVLPLIFFLLYNAKDAITKAQKDIDYKGILVILLGIFVYYVGYRSFQCRISIAALPFLLLGGCWFLWGKTVAKLVAFPFFLFLLSIPIPGFQQATVGLQIIATQMADIGTNLLGIGTYVQGTNILPTNSDWDMVNIAGGCSGIRSLTSLILFSATWAYLTPMAMWKKCALFLSAIPIAIIGNGFRIISIFVMAEYVDPKFAVTTWHDWSTFILFFPISLFCLLAMQTILTGEVPWKRHKRKVVVRQNMDPIANLNEQP